MGTVYLDTTGGSGTAPDVSRPFITTDVRGNVVINIPPGMQLQTQQGGVTNVILDNGTGGGGDSLTPPISITNSVIGTIPLSIKGASGQTADLFDITANGGAAGGLLKVDSAGTLTTGGGTHLSFDGRVQTNYSGVSRGGFQFLNPASGAYSGLSGYGFMQSHTNTVDTIVNGTVVLQGASVASGVNQIMVTGAATGNAPIIAATGSDTNVSLLLQPKGTGIVSLIDTNGTAVLRVVGSGGTGANQITVSGSVAGAGPSISVTGTDTNADMYLQAKGAANINLQTAGQTALRIGNVASAVNLAVVTPAATAGSPTISVVGTDTNIDFQLRSKGTGLVDIGPASASVAISGATPAVPGNTGGGTGPATAAQNSWLAIKVNGVTSYVPVWR